MNRKILFLTFSCFTFFQTNAQLSPAITSWLQNSTETGSYNMSGNSTAIDDTQHSPLIGFAYDGFPIYGAYGFQNADGCGGIVSVKSGYQLRNITNRTEWADGTNVDNGPEVSTTYFLGYFREDYEWLAHPGEEDYLDEHNGKFCMTPEYPDGTYAYFATVEENWNSAYPYVVGPTFYGISEDRKVNAVNESTTVYDTTIGISTAALKELQFSIFPNPASDLIAVQISGLLKNDLTLHLYDLQGRIVKSSTLNQGSTIWHIDTQTLYTGEYILHISIGEESIVEKIIVMRE